MAGKNIGKLVISLTGDTKQFQADMQKAQARIGKLSQGFMNAGKKMAIAGGIITGAMGLAVKTFGDFEQSMKNVQSVSGAIAEELAKLGDMAKTLAPKFGKTAKEAGDAMYYLASAGMSANEISKALEGTFALATATQADLAYTTNIVAATLSQFGLAAGETDRVANVFAGTIANSQATIQKLGDAMRYAGPMANTLGMQIEETSAAMAMFFNAGFRGEQAGTMFRSAMAKLLDPSAEAEQVLKRLNIAMSDLDPTTHSLADIIKVLENAEVGAADMTKIFGLEAGPSMMALISQGSDALVEMTAKIKDTDDAYRISGDQLKTFQGAMKQLRAEFLNAQVVMGQILAPTIIKLGNGIKTLFTLWSDMPKVMQKIITIGTALTGVIALLGGGFLIFAGSIMKAMPILIKMPLALGKIKIAMIGLNGAMALTVIGITSLVALVVGAEIVARKWSKALKDIDASQRESQSSEERIARYKQLKDALKELGLEYDAKLLKELALKTSSGNLGRIEKAYGELVAENTQKERDGQPVKERELTILDELTKKKKELTENLILHKEALANLTINSWEYVEVEAKILELETQLGIEVERKAQYLKTTTEIEEYEIHMVQKLKNEWMGIPSLNKKVSKSFKEMSSSILSVAYGFESMFEMMKDGEFSISKLLKSISGIAMMVGMPQVGLIAGLGGIVGGLFGLKEGGLILPGAREGVMINKQPALLPISEGGKAEIVSPVDKFFGLLQGMQPQIEIHSGDPKTYVKFRENMPIGMQDRLFRNSTLPSQVRDESR